MQRDYLLRRVLGCAALLLLLLLLTGCESSEVSGPMDHTLDGQAEAISAAGGKMEIHLDFTRSEITDSDLAALPLPATATSIDLSYTKVTDAGLVHLKRLANLQKVRIANTPITDEGIETLMTLDNLWLVDADQSQISRKGQLRLLKFLAPRAQARAIQAGSTAQRL